MAQLAWAQDAGAQSVLDLACGNLRFAHFAQGRCPNVRIWAVDNCDELAVLEPSVHYQHLDIANALLDGQDLHTAIDAPPCDLCVCFGFMHHIPVPRHRAQVLRALARHTTPSGLIAVSFWQFEKDPRIMAKAQPLAHNAGCAKGDYLLGWQGRTDVQRYCHSFEEEELDALTQHIAPLAVEIDRFSADGKSGDLNRYLVFRRTAQC